MKRRLALVLLLAVPVFGKSLHWRSVDVNARLDRDGRLHVVERQRIVFDGDWNGGERDFQLRAGQTVLVNRIVRVDGGREIPLGRGDLDAVDRWDYAKRGVVRWRSRLPSDPPFENRELEYVLDYTYSKILAPAGARFRLAHDFGLPERDGEIGVFRLRVDFDPVWNMRSVQETRAPLEPGQSVFVNADLAYPGGGWPAGVAPVPWWIGPAALVFFVIGAALLLRAFVRGEREAGRFAPLPVQFDPELMRLKAELAGAAWDATTGRAEVAALLARMAQEGKITSRAEGDALHLKRNVPLHELTGYEYELASKLFVDGDETDTAKLREHYARTGFHPAAVIRPGIEHALAEAVPGWKTSVRRFNPWLRIAMLLVALAIIVGGLLFSPDPELVLPFLFPGIVFALLAGVTAWFASRAVTNFVRAFIGPAILLALPILGFAFVALRAAGLRTGAFAPFAIAVWLLVLLQLVLDLLKIRDPREVLAFRRRIAGARRFFAEQLRLPQPALRDEWFPYVLAFGLGEDVDRWFRSFGGTAASTSSWTPSPSLSSSSSSSSSSTPSWTGGGGAFGGAGATGSWAVAATAIAAGVSAPSSSGGGGGGGGGSISGGGGGGGW